MSDIEKMKVFDSRVVQKRPAYAVSCGALSNTNAPFNAISATSSSMTYNIQSPSLSVFMDRNTTWSAGCNLQMDVQVGAAPAPIANAGEPVVVWGRDCALAPYPLHSLCGTQTATINDCVSTLNTNDILYELVRLMDQRKNKLSKATPSMLDKYQNYDEAVGAINNPLGSYYDATDYDNIPNGAFWDLTFTDNFGTPLNGNGTYNDGTNTINYVDGVPVLTDDGGGVNCFQNYRVFFRFNATENLLLSPYIFNEECADSVGLFGVNNVQLVFNFQPPTRLVRNAPAAGGALSRTVSNTAYASAAPWVNPRIDQVFLTPPLDIALPPKSVVNYMDYSRYISTPGQSIAPGSSALLQTQTITLPMIPDMLLLFAKPQNYADATVGDFYCPISRVSINWDNYAGILSSHTTQQLYEMSVENGLKMDWNSWNGRGKVNLATGSGNASLVGGFLCLKMGKDITMQSGSAPGVVGSYTFQAQCTVNNRTGSAVTPVIYMVAVNSGFFMTQNGSSQIIKGPLTEADVISAPPAPMGEDDLNRLVGGGFFGKLGSALSKAKAFLGRPEVRGVAKELARSSGNKYLKGAADLADAVGMGRTGGSVTGGRKARLHALM